MHVELPVGEKPIALSAARTGTRKSEKAELTELFFRIRRLE